MPARLGFLKAAGSAFFKETRTRHLQTIRALGTFKFAIRLSAAIAVEAQLAQMFCLIVLTDDARVVLEKLKVARAFF